jgi:hypothetical protein
METRRWLNQAQPQTLVIAVLLMYFDAVMGALFGGLFNPFSLAVIIASVAAGYGISNERKWGYYLGLAVAVFFLLPFVLNLVQHGSLGGDIIGLAFAVAKFALLVHPQSREYQRIWFK